MKHEGTHFYVFAMRTQEDAGHHQILADSQNRITNLQTEIE